MRMCVYTYNYMLRPNQYTHSVLTKQILYTSENTLARGGVGTHPFRPHEANILHFCVIICFTSQESWRTHAVAYIRRIYGVYMA